MIAREIFLQILQAGHVAGRHDFVAAAAADWLAAWPGDLDVQLCLAPAAFHRAQLSAAADRLRRLVASDPEDRSAQELLARVYQRQGDSLRSVVHAACAQALRGLAPGSGHWPSWAAPLGRAVRALGNQESAVALSESGAALMADADIPLPAVIAMRAQLASGKHEAAFGLARSAADRWPEAIAFRIVRARDGLARGEISRGVEHLHRAAADDPAGRLAERYLGAGHPYRELWPRDLQASLGRPVPAEVQAILGENRLAAGAQQTQASGAKLPTPQRQAEVDRPHSTGEVQQSASSRTRDSIPSDPRSRLLDPGELDLPAPEPWEAYRGPDPGDDHAVETKDMPNQAETLIDVRHELERIATRLRAPGAHAADDARVPAYIVLSSRTRLTQDLGEAKFRRVDEAVLDLVESVRSRQGWTAYRVYVDDPDTLTPFRISPVDPANAWQVKLRLGDLDEALGQRGEMIGAVLIVGGHKTIPFHLLPNPTDDDDSDVPSDNPYATRDENYFAVEWPVGRIACDSQADLMVRLLRRAAEHHRTAAAPLALQDRIRMWLALRLGRLFGRRPRSLGYTASVWRKASLAVFRAIGDPNALMASPPVSAAALPPLAFRPTRFSYYNLHGMADAPEWFGQRDPLAGDASGEEFPIALRPEDVVDGGRAPKLVFTEACYGANALGRTSEDAISLRFLEMGSEGVVGSTKISYGSVTPPLIAADLLGRLFWEQATLGTPAGEALRRAKIALANEMHRRQGFLDGEDQKTLISFVLYGDPLYAIGPAAASVGSKAFGRKTGRAAEVKTACALGGPERDAKDLDPMAYERVKMIVAQYLPGMGDARARVHAQRCGCDGKDHLCPSHQLGMKAAGTVEDTMVVTLSKSIPEGPRKHMHFARLTLDPSGRVLKLAVSR